MTETSADSGMMTNWRCSTAAAAMTLSASGNNSLVNQWYDEDGSHLGS